MHTAARITIICLWLTSASSQTVWSQTAPPTPPPIPLIRAQSTLVLVPTLVRTQHGDLVYTLSASDFRLTDNTIEQKLILEEDAGAQPLALVVLVETGGAGARQIKTFRKLGSMLQTVVASAPHRVAIASFDSQPTLLQDFTSDDATIGPAMDELDAGDQGSATLDALAFAVDLLKRQPPQFRRAILLISETIDHGSTTKLNDAMRAITDTNTAIYSLAFSSSKSEMKHEAPKIFGQISLGGVATGPSAPPGPAGGCMSREQGTAESGEEDLPDSRFTQAWDCLSLLAPPLRVAKMAAMLARNGLRRNVPQTVAEMTGGEVFKFSNLKDMERDLLSISNHLPNRYILSFQPQSPSPGVHALALTLPDHPQLSVTARNSYWAK